MTNIFSHGYALLIGVGRCAYDPWSLPVTVRDMQALSKEKTSFFDTATEDFPVALLREARACRPAAGRRCGMNQHDR